MKHIGVLRRRSLTLEQRRPSSGRVPVIFIIIFVHAERMHIVISEEGQLIYYGILFFGKFLFLGIPYMYTVHSSGVIPACTVTLSPG